MRKRVTFSKEFKLEAVRLLDLGKKSAVELALELGVRRNQLYKRKNSLAGRRTQPSAVLVASQLPRKAKLRASSVSLRRSRKSATF
jgi:transposase-like protein